MLGSSFVSVEFCRTARGWATSSARDPIVDKTELMRLQKEFGRVTSRAADSLITKDQFDVALQAVGFHDADKEIMSRIFVLLDRGADYRIQYREFLVGMGVMVRGTFKEKLQFAFDLYDIDEVHAVSREETLFIMRGINRFIPFFGDEAMDDAKVHQVVEEVYIAEDKEKTGSVGLETVVNGLATHATLLDYVASVPEQSQ